MKRIACIMALALALAGCSVEKPAEPARTSQKFVLSASAPATRAIEAGSADDNAVDEVTVLLFDAATDLFVGKSRFAAPQKVTGNRYRFIADLPRGTYKALFVANAAAIIDGAALTAQTSVDAAEYSLFRVLFGKYNSAPGSGGYAPFVLSSARETFTVPFEYDKYEKDPIKLVRDVAKIDVRMGSDAVRQALAMKEIRLCNYNFLSYSVPMPTPGEARPANGIISGYDESSAIIYLASDGEIPGGECVDRIFTPERPAEDQNNNSMYLLVRADVTLGGQTRADRWFKLAVMRGGRNVDVMRNHVYTFRVEAVGDWGYGSIDDAAAALPGNLVVDLQTEQDGLNEVVYNGQYYLAVTAKEYVFPAAGSSRALDIHTDYPAGWSISDGWPAWITARPAPSGAGGQTARGSLAASANTAVSERSFSFTVDAGPLRQRVTVRQLAAAAPPPPPPPAPTLSVNPDPVRLGHQSGSQAAIVVTTNQGGWSVASKPAWVSVDTSTGAITAAEANPAGSERTGQLTITAGKAAPVTITVIQAARPFVPYPDVDPSLLAPPGVLGVTEDGELTLRGSREYEGTDIAGNAGFGPVHEKTVYIAYFKFGSNVPLRPDDSWGLSQPSMTNGWPNDPCPLATVDAQGGKGAGWRVPSIANGYWNGMSGLAPGSVVLKNGKTVQGRYDAPGWTMFLPYAGSLTQSGMIAINYWSSTMHDSQGSRYLYMSASRIQVSIVASQIAAPVRCVR